MKHIWAWIILIFTWSGIRAQDSSRWIDLFSYRNIQAIALDGERVMGGADNAVFIFDPADGKYRKFSTVQGLSGQDLQQIYYHNPTGQLFVVHAGGRIELIHPGDGKVKKEQGLYLAHIPDEQKQVRAIASEADMLYLAMPYGLTEYRMNPAGFGDTYRLGPGGTDMGVNDVAVFQGRIYAATEGNGILSVDVNEPYKGDLSRWQQIDGGTWNRLAVFGGRLMAVKGTGLYEIAGGTAVYWQNLPAAAVDMTANSQNLFVGLTDRILVYDASIHLVQTINRFQGKSFHVQALAARDGHLYVGTRSQGILHWNFTDNTSEQILPEGPLYNHPFAADAYNGNLWVVYGDYDQLYNPYPLDHYGISRFADGHWHNIPYSAIGKVSLTDVKINRNDTTQVFVGSFHQGLLEFRQGSLYRVYDPSNSTLQPIVINGQPLTDYRVSPLVWDKDGNLWMFEGLVMDEVHRFDLSNNAWNSFSFSAIMNTAYNEGAADMQFDRSGNLWMATHRLGVVGLNPETGELVTLTENNNIPYEGGYRNTQATAVDKDNTLWIGTLRGLRILRNPERAFTDPEVRTEPIIIELAELHGQDNQGVELMANQEITEIVVDGANNKWIGTTNAGLFYVSADGQETIYHFTAENSPLPGNAIFDVAIDPITGVVYISTDKGLIGFRGDATEGKDNLDKAYVYPNPLNQKRHQRLIIRNLMSDISVKITDIEGNLVWETRSRGGTVEWDLRNFSGRKVATGVYLVLLTDDDTTHTKVLKALIVK